MTSYRRFKWMLLGIVLTAAGGWLCWFTYTHREPTYQGRPLDYWVDQVPFTLTPLTSNGAVMAVPGNRLSVRFTRRHTGETPAEALRAVKTIGDRALPFLLARLEARDTPMKTNLQRWSAKLGYQRQLFEPAMLARGEAVTALIALKPFPESALERLRALSTNAEPQIAGVAKLVLAMNWNELESTSISYYPRAAEINVRGQTNGK